MKSIAYFFFLGMIVATSVEARYLTNSEIVRRCYIQMTGTRLRAGDPILERAKAGEDGGLLCASLLDSVSLGSNNMIQSSRGDGVLFLQRFHEIHRNWLGKKWINQADVSQDPFFFTPDVYDGSEPSLFITRALFTPGMRYESVLRGTTGLRAKRDPSSLSVYAKGANGVARVSRYMNADPKYDDFFIDVSGGVAGPLVRVPTSLVQVGVLMGIEPQTETASSPFVWLGAPNPSVPVNPPGIVVPQLIYQNYGGGAIGTIPYLLMNFGHSTTYQTNGTTKLPRRWMQSVFEDFLCRSGAMARETDVGGYLRGATAAPFRQQKSCLRCHSAYDQAALTTRNITPASFSNFLPADGGRTTTTAGHFVVDTAEGPGQEPWPVLPVTNFSRQPPKGQLFFRSIDGTLVQKPVNNLDELGTALSLTDDFYACAADHYLEYFTGIKVPLFDMSDTANESRVSSMTAADREARQFVIDLGAELKVTGQVKKVIQRIFASDFYKKTDFNRAKKVK